MWPPARVQNYGEVWEGFLEYMTPGSHGAFPKVRMAGERAQDGYKSHVTFEQHQEVKCGRCHRGRARGLGFGLYNRPR